MESEHFPVGAGCAFDLRFVGTQVGGANGKMAAGAFKDGNVDLTGEPVRQGRNGSSVGTNRNGTNQAGVDLFPVASAVL